MNRSMDVASLRRHSHQRIRRAIMSRLIYTAVGDTQVLVLVLGDLHIPHRAPKLPDQFKALLVPGKISHILFTGNLVDRTVLDYLRSLANEVHIVRGDFDDVLHLPGVVEALPDNLTITIGEFKIGLIHGHQLVPWGDAESLAAAQRALDADILISGHTHRFATYAYDGALFVNPGSATGAFTALQPTADGHTPSFVLMDLQGTKAITYVYELVDEEVKVKKIEHVKGMSMPIASPPPPDVRFSPPPAPEAAPTTAPPAQPLSPSSSPKAAETSDTYSAPAPPPEAASSPAALEPQAASMSENSLALPAISMGGVTSSMQPSAYEPPASFVGDSPCEALQPPSSPPTCLATSPGAPESLTSKDDGAPTISSDAAFKPPSGSCSSQAAESDAGSDSTHDAVGAPAMNTFDVHPMCQPVELASNSPGQVDVDTIDRVHHSGAGSCTAMAGEDIADMALVLGDEQSTIVAARTRLDSTGEEEKHVDLSDSPRELSEEAIETCSLPETKPATEPMVEPEGEEATQLAEVEGNATAVCESQAT